MVSFSGCRNRVDGDFLTIKPQPRAYTVSGHYAADGNDTTAVPALFVIADGRDTVATETVQVDTSGRFSFTLATRDVDELRLLTPAGHVVRMFALAGGRYDVAIDGTGRATFAADDTLNGWLHAVSDTLSRLPFALRRRMADSLCLAHPATVRTALMLRDEMRQLGDTLFVRRCLGHLTQAAKPAWLMAQIDSLMDGRARLRQPNLPMGRHSFTDVDGKTFTLQSLNQEAQLLTVWADYDSASVADLSRLAAVARDYGVGEDNLARLRKRSDGKPRRLNFVTFCLYAPDSAAWRKAIEGLPGRHVWLPEGFNHPAIRSWAVTSFPDHILVNTSTTLRYRGPLDNDMRARLDSLPQRSTPSRPSSERKKPVATTRSGQ